MAHVANVPRDKKFRGTPVIYKSPRKVDSAAGEDRYFRVSPP
jgi:hypothetical protein